LKPFLLTYLEADLSL